MNYIINPSWFYWLNVVDGLKVVLLAITIVGGIVGVCAALCGIDDWISDKEVKKLRKISKISIIIFLVCIIAFIFIPSKQTLIEMQVAKFATYENAEWTVDTIKSAVDYIVEAVESIK